jgi:hypothetical protein
MNTGAHALLESVRTMVPNAFQKCVNAAPNSQPNGPSGFLSEMEILLPRRRAGLTQVRTENGPHFPSGAPGSQISCGAASVAG